MALVRVGEECAELAKEAGKALRFGPRNRWPAGDPTNVEKMATEFRDVLQALRDARVFLTTGTISGVAYQNMTAGPKKECACCPDFPQHLYGYGVTYHEAQLYAIDGVVRNIDDFGGRAIDRFIDDHFKVPGIAGKRVRIHVAVEVIDDG